MSANPPRSHPSVSPEVKKKFFITHVGWVTVNNYGTVTLEANVQTPVGYEVREGQQARVVVHVDTIREIERGIREAVAEMRKEGTYVR